MRKATIVTMKVSIFIAEFHISLASVHQHFSFDYQLYQSFCPLWFQHILDDPHPLKL